MQKDEAAESIDRIIQLCIDAESGRADPFSIDVKSNLEKLRILLSLWKTVSQLSKDVEAVYRIALLIRLQEEVVKHRSSLLYADPLLVEIKILASDPKDLARAFLRAWRPIVSMQQVNLEQLRLAYGYWSNLRRLRLDQYDTSSMPSQLDVEKLKEMGFISEEIPSQVLEELHRDLVKKCENGRINYWDFVSNGDFTSTVKKAVLVSFLVTLGYAELEIEPLENRIWLKPKLPPGIPKTAEKKSLVISIKS
ncbi:MAG: hypothetical protein ACUVTL_04610 [Thermoproteota archaeon]